MWRDAIYVGEFLMAKVWIAGAMVVKSGDEIDGRMLRKLLGCNICYNGID